MKGPLSGVRVVDFSAVVSGPLAAMWLADQGADVIKVETLGNGDVTRGIRASPEMLGLGGLYTNCNRGKRSLSIDVTADDGRAAVLELCRTADVFLQNWRPGVVERLGLGYEHVSAVNPDIIYVSISGFGPDGPYSQRRVYDPIIQGLTGHVAVQFNPEVPFPDLVRTIVCDKATALTVAQSVSAALFARERGAGGPHLIVPMLDVGMSFFFPDGYQAKAWLDDPKADDRLTLAKIYRVTPTADGHLIYFCASDSEFHGLYRALGHDEWVIDPRFADPRGRQDNAVELGSRLAEAFETWKTDELVPRLGANDVPFAPVLDLDAVQQNVQIVHNESLRVRDHESLGRLLEARHPVRFSKTPVEVTPVAPTLGMHTEEILRELGRTDADIEALRTAGVIA
jgi:crotonobetainyl-CoA:carnitine CoA-transferase CaiB-like acyl-CoA transferase